MGTKIKDIVERVLKTLVAVAIGTGAVGPLLAALLHRHFDMTAASTIYTAVCAAVVSLLVNWLTSFSTDTISPASLVKAVRGQRVGR
jgi:fucose permease